jgi:adenylate kinase family enzyme
VERDYEAFLKIQKALVSEAAWIIDGNSTKFLEIRYAQADLAVHLNYPRWRCYYRVFKRLFERNRVGDDRAPGCATQVRWSLPRYMWHFPKNKDAGYYWIS